MKRVLIAPSLLACDLGHIADEVADAVAGGADLLHFDVMDGQFVPNLTFGPAVCAAVRRLTALPLDVHLMIVHPDDAVRRFADAGANRIAVHAEAAVHLHRTLAHVRESGASAGVAINPTTPVSALEEAWPFLDYILVMSVNPGFGGQAFIPEMVPKIRRLAAIRDRQFPDVEIAVDGGVDPDTAPGLCAAGADVLIAGTAVFGTSDRARAIRALKGEL